MLRLVKPPAALDSLDMSRAVFLAGSIEMGVAENWQLKVSRELQAEDLVVLNPRRDNWDAAWEQTISHPQFREQVEWELAAQEAAAMIAMYFEPSTKSPVTLLELGLFAHSERIVVCCPEGFWRRGNVEIVCRRYRVPLVDTLGDLIEAIRRRFAQ